MLKIALALAFGALVYAYQPSPVAAGIDQPVAKPATVVAAESDCTENEIWNPDTEKCEKKEQ
jgi:hypothetical protein